jgi:hypothetical protein
MSEFKAGIMDPHIQEKFNNQVREIVFQDPSVSYIEAILESCEHHGIEPEAASKLISRPIRERVEIEARQRNFRVGEKVSRLPI